MSDSIVSPARSRQVPPNLTDIRLEGGLALIGDCLEDTTIDLDSVNGVIGDLGGAARARTTFNADGLFILPGIVDIHGDAFERQMMPRPGVGFAVDIAMLESDRQAIANGITTVFHGVTWSWEPGLRGPDNARALLDSIERLRPRLCADTRFHLRHETFNIAAEEEILGWLSERRIDALAFNDHMLIAEEATTRPQKLAQMVERSGLTREAFLQLVERIKQCSGQVPGSIERLAKAAAAAGIPLLSHDDNSPKQRDWFRALGCRLAEFPTNLETAQAAAAAGDDIVLGAPNVVRGGSHIGWINAKEMIARGLCSVLASDYYYPAQLIAAFRLVSDGVLPLEQAWRLVSRTPAAAVGLADRGSIAVGHRADLIVVDARETGVPRLIATIVAGRMVHLADATRLGSS
jgi:alpha-D-ribose 1-methylphosphonate 5-triphosphate diphosphatase